MYLIATVEWQIDRKFSNNKLMKHQLTIGG